MSSEEGQNIFMPKNINCITIILIIKGSYSIKIKNKLIMQFAKSLPAKIYFSCG